MKEMITWEGDSEKMTPYEQLGNFLATFATLNRVIGKQIVEFKDCGSILEDRFNKISRKKYAKCKKRFLSCCKINTGGGNSLTDIIVTQFTFADICMILREQILTHHLTPEEKKLIRNIFQRITEISTMRNRLCHGGLYHMDSKLGCIYSNFNKKGLLDLKEDPWEKLDTPKIIEECRIFSTILPVMTFGLKNSHNLNDIIKPHGSSYKTNLGALAKYVDCSITDIVLDQH